MTQNTHLNITIYVGNAPVLSFDTNNYQTSNVIVHHDVASLAILDPNQRHMYGLEKRLQNMFDTDKTIYEIIDTYDLTHFPSVLWQNVKIIVKDI